MNARKVGLGVLVIALVLGGVVVTRIVTRSGQEDVFLESANSLGKNPFTTAGVVQAAAAAQVTPAGTTTTALFGGSGNIFVCDPEGLIAFLTTHNDKAMAWVEARNADKTFRWGKNWDMTKITLADIPAYIHELIPTHLVRATRVTNTGYVPVGHHSEHQSLLQEGMAVLANRLGKVEVKCFCGNILWWPHHVANVHYVGICWPGCHDVPVCDGGPGCTDVTTTSTTEVSRTTTSCVDTATHYCGPPPPPPPPPPPGPPPPPPPLTDVTRTTSVQQTTRTTSQTTRTTQPDQKTTTSACPAGIPPGQC